MDGCAGIRGASAGARSSVCRQAPWLVALDRGGLNRSALVHVSVLACCVSGDYTAASGLCEEAEHDGQCIRCAQREGISAAMHG